MFNNRSSSSRFLLLLLLSILMPIVTQIPANPIVAATIREVSLCLLLPNDNSSQRGFPLLLQFSIFRIPKVAYDPTTKLEVSLWLSPTIRKLTLTHGGPGQYAEDLKKYGKKVSDQHPRGITAIGVTAFGSDMHFGHSVPNVNSRIPPTLQRHMQDQRAKNAYNPLNRGVPNHPPPPNWAEGNCAEFSTVTPCIPRTLPSPGDLNTGKCIGRGCDKIVTLTISRRTGEAMAMCEHCQRLADAVTSAHPGMQIVDFGDPLGRGMGLSTSLPGGAPVADSTRFTTYEDPRAVSGFSCFKNKLTSDDT
jgi:hypothetical protein